MKKLLIVAAFVFGALVTNAQLVPSVDTASFRPIIDTSVHGFEVCKIATIHLSLNADSITRIALRITSDNLKNYADVSILFLNESLQPLATLPFTLQDDALFPHVTKNYTNVQNNGNEYLFQIAASYLKTVKGIIITFK